MCLMKGRSRVLLLALLYCLQCLLRPYIEDLLFGFLFVTGDPNSPCTPRLCVLLDSHTLSQRIPLVLGGLDVYLIFGPPGNKRGLENMADR